MTQYERDGNFYDDDEDASDYCAECDDEGRRMICPDDMCRGVGECIHGDGYVICPRCNGESAW